MKLVEKGNLEPKQVKKKCKNCDAVFIYGPKDIDSDYREKPFVVCPSCEIQITI